MTKTRRAGFRKKHRRGGRKTITRKGGMRRSRVTKKRGGKRRSRVSSRSRGGRRRSRRAGWKCENDPKHGKAANWLNCAFKNTVGKWGDCPKPGQTRNCYTPSSGSYYCC